MSQRLILLLGACGVVLLSVAAICSPWQWAAFIPPGLFLIYLFVTAEEDANVSSPRS